MELILLIILAAVLISYVVKTYNSLVTLRNHIRDAWSNIDTELKRRYELIPNLVATVKGYAAQEREVFERVARIRAECLANQGPATEQAAGENRLAETLKSLLAVAENYPRLKSDRHFLELQRELAETEDRIQAARRFYNGNVRDYLIRCQAFPSSVIANLFGFRKEDYIHIRPSVRGVPDVDFS